MNLWLRFLRVVMAAFLSRQRLAPEAVSALTMRVWPTDLDLNFHMNNGRYLTLMDLGRIDLLMRASLARPFSPGAGCRCWQMHKFVTVARWGRSAVFGWRRESPAGTSTRCSSRSDS